MNTEATTERALDLETAPLGHPFTAKELEAQCTQVVGGIGWPGKQPGAGVIVARSAEAFPDGCHLVLLDEVDAADIGDLIRKCRTLAAKYRPAWWVGHGKHAAAQRFLMETRQYDFPVRPSALLEDPAPYPFMLATLKDLLRAGGRRLFLKGGAVVGHLSAIVPEDVPYLAVGAWPAVEALAAAVADLRPYDDLEGPQEDWSRDHSPMRF
jgi:hypothetical protein